MNKLIGVVDKCPVSLGSWGAESESSDSNLVHSIHAVFRQEHRGVIRLPPIGSAILLSVGIQPTATANMSCFDLQGGLGRARVGTPSHDDGLRMVPPS